MSTFCLHQTCSNSPQKNSVFFPDETGTDRATRSTDRGADNERLRRPRTGRGAMTPDQLDDLCEYIDGRREAGHRYDEIADSLECQLPEEALEQLEIWHLEWKRRQLKNDPRRPLETVSGEGAGIAGGRAAVEPWCSSGSYRQREMVQSLAERLIGRDALADGVKIEWRPIFQRSLKDGQTCETVQGPGQAHGHKWLHSAVIFRSGERIDHVEAEARIRRRVRPGSNRASAAGLSREAVQLEKLQFVSEKLDIGQVSARLAALLQTYLGRKSGIKSGAHLARLTNRTRQAVSARKLLIAEDYYKKTGGKAGFEGLTSAARHREKVSSERSLANLN